MEGQCRLMARMADHSRNICKVLVLPHLLGIDHAENTDGRKVFVFSFHLIPELGKATSHYPRKTGFLVGKSWGSSSQKPGLHFLSSQSHVHPVPRGRREGAPLNSMPLFLALVLFLHLHTEQCACVIFPLNFLSAASLAEESAREL